MAVLKTVFSFIIRIALYSLLSLYAATSLAAPVIGATSADRTAIVAGSQTTVKITAHVPDRTVIPASINVQRANESGTFTSVLGTLHDDGLNGDAIANDHIYTIQLPLSEPNVGSVKLRVSAGFKGVVRRIFSKTLNIDVVPAIVHGEFLGWRDLLDLYSIRLTKGDNLNVRLMPLEEPLGQQISGAIFDPSLEMLQYGTQNYHTNLPLPPAFFLLTAQDSGYYTLRFEGNYATEYRIQALVNGVLAPIEPYRDGGSVIGTVYRNDGLTPIPGQAVRLIGQDFFPIDLRTVTDQSGTYRFDGVPLFNYMVEASGPNLIGLGKTTGQILSKGQVVQTNVVLPIKANIKLKIVNADGAPVSQPIQVNVYSKDYSTFPLTNNSGEAEFETWGTPLTIGALHPMVWAMSELKLEPQKDGETINAILPLPPTGTIRGRLLINGFPLRYTMLMFEQAVPGIPDATNRWSAYTDGDGMYYFKLIPVGVPFKIEAQVGYGPTAPSSMLEGSLDYNNQIKEIDVAINTPKTVVMGMVLYESGEPVNTGSVRAYDEVDGSSITVSNAADGSYVITGLPVGRQVRLEAYSFAGIERSGPIYVKIPSAGQVLTNVNLTVR